MRGRGFYKVLSRDGRHIGNVRALSDTTALLNVCCVWGEEVARVEWWF